MNCTNILWKRIDRNCGREIGGKLRYNVDRTYIDIVCPYFTSETERGINCEGCLKGSDRIKTSFMSVEEKKAHITQNCCVYPNKCVIAVANDNKYFDAHIENGTRCKVPEKYFVNIEELADMLTISKRKAYDIGKAAGALSKMGRRNIYAVSKVLAYTEQHKKTLKKTKEA